LHKYLKNYRTCHVFGRCCPMTVSHAFFFFKLGNFIALVYTVQFGEFTDSFNVCGRWVSCDSLPSAWCFLLRRLCYLSGGICCGMLLIRGFGWSISVEWWREYAVCSVCVTNGIFVALRIVAEFLISVFSSRRLRCLVQWNMTDNWVRVICMCEMVSWVWIVRCGIHYYNKKIKDSEG
jgi:hypothetical protein